VTYAACANISPEQARKAYGRGCENLKEKVEENIESVRAIHAAYNNLLSVKDTALLESMGVHDDQVYGNSESDDTVSDAPSDSESEHRFEIDNDIPASESESDTEPLLVDSSSSSEDEIPERLAGLSSGDPQLIALVNRRRAKLRRQHNRLMSERIARERLMKRTMNGSTRSLLKRHPDIGTRMERIVREAGVGADKWRSSSSLTWERQKVGQKMTMFKLRRVLGEEIGEKISHGTLVQLCVPRNKRFRSSARYKGAANIVSKRARKGFEVKINVDDRWSNALYRSLDKLQETDNSNIFYLNRDDAAGYRLNTLACSNKFPTLMVQGHEDLATRTDFTTKDNSQIQVTSYHFTGSKTTTEDYAGVVKANHLTPKTPSQHASDLRMVRDEPRFHHVFYQANGHKKLIDCIRVDGGGDENPDHLEQKFIWSEWHLEEEKLATFVSTRFSGGSYLNRVEHMNGQLTRAHANTFIPSNLLGPNKDPITGDHSEERLAANLQAAVDIYISRVNNTPYKENTIKLFKASSAGDFGERRPLLIEYLKASDKKKLELQKRYSHDQRKMGWLNHFKRVLAIQKAHEMESVKYVFSVICCFDVDCSHPLCVSNAGRKASDFKWHDNGPPLDFFPWPSVDCSRNLEMCTQCTYKCVGHFLSFSDLLEQYERGIRVDPGAHLPTAVIGAVFSKRKDEVNQKRKTDVGASIEPLAPSEVSDLSRLLCITEDKVKYLFDHLCSVHLARRRGAQKAAETRARQNALKNQ
jgi:hypothetical protein